MRIKFRQVLYKKGKFDRFSYWGFGVDSSLFCSPSTDNIGNFLRDAEKNSDPFTGLRDKNLKEAYKNDVIEHPSAGTAVICWVDNGWAARSLVSGLCYKISDRNFEIIGSVYTEDIYTGNTKETV